MSYYALIYESPHAEAEGESVTLGQGSDKVTVVTVAEAGQTVPWSLKLLASGVERIELCGGMSPVQRDQVMAAVAGRVPVSSVAFGIESLRRAAAYNASFEAGNATKEAFIILIPGADTKRDRILQAHPPQHTTLLPVPDVAKALEAARKMVEDGVELIELYGFDTRGAAAVITTVDGAAPVGVGSFGLEALRPIE